jgi:hypothetical protein
MDVKGACDLIRQPYKWQMFGRKVFKEICGSKKGGNYEIRNLHRSI